MYPPTRNFLLTILVITLVTACGVVFATGKPCQNGASNYPTCTFPEPPVPPPSSTSTAAAAAAARATGGNARQGQQQGQQMGQGQEANSGASITDNSSGGSFKNSMWVFPAPVFTPPLPPIAGCPGANIEQFAGSVGWSFASVAKASVNTDNCTAITLYNQYVATCKYASAQQVLDLLSTKVLPGFKPAQWDKPLLDLTHNECGLLKAPITQHVTNRYETIYQVPPAPVAKPPVKRKPAAKKSPCPVGDKAVLMCKPKVAS